ncbi:MAG: outer membrane lipoprotein carrier protein LolA [Gammaproteobacteria bacterium]|nr:MAG: outer membrane lipoprotein carrier protein LolA [Gammaproteobacteria bacterium]
MRTINFLKNTTIVSILFFMSFTAQADKANKLDKIIQSIDTLQGNFSQTLHNDKGEVLQKSTGNYFIKKPNKFYWDYKTPHKQLVISNGKSLWLYDTDLEQVTIKNATKSTKDSPISVLLNKKNLATAFKIKKLNRRENLNWHRLQSKEEDSSFKEFYVGFDDNYIKVMELHDNFGNITQILFENNKKNLSIQSSFFDYKPPKGVDIIGGKK